MATWIGGNYYLSLKQMQNNALIIYDNFYSYGWTLNAISAILGNMQSESSINPNIWENLKPNTARGYGLTQWTPATKLISWAGNLYTSGTKQCERIRYESQNGLQWFLNPSAPIVNPPISFAEFVVSTDNVGTLANYFLWYYEHPKKTIQPERAEQAAYWYEFLSGVAPEPPEPPAPKLEFLPMPIALYLKRRI